MVVSPNLHSPGVLYAVRSSASVLADLGGVLLTDAEIERAGRLRAAARDDFLAGHHLVRHCVARLAGLRPADVTIDQSCDVCGRADHGRPRVRGRPDIHVSLAHSRGAVAAAAGWSPLGIDVEAGPYPALRIDEVAATLAPAELSAVRSATDPNETFIRYWVRKEALVKLGVVDLDGLGTLDLAMLPVADRSVGRRHHRFGGWHVVDWSVSAPESVGALVAGDDVRFRDIRSFADS